jgi:hypothetical protein
LEQIRAAADAQVNGGAAHVTLQLPRQGVSLIELTW